MSKNLTAFFKESLSVVVTVEKKRLPSRYQECETEKCWIKVVNAVNFPIVL